MIPSERFTSVIPATSNLATKERLALTFELPLVEVRFDPVGEEPRTPLEAVLFKLNAVATSVGNEAVVYAADVGFRIDREGHELQVKPARDPECVEIDPRYGIPKKILDRYQSQELAIWEIACGFLLPDGRKELACIRIETEVPALSPEQIVKYFSSESSAGILLVMLLNELFPDKIHLVTTASGEKIAINKEEAWSCIVDKVPPYRILAQMLEGSLSHQRQTEDFFLTTLFWD